MGSNSHAGAKLLVEDIEAARVELKGLFTTLAEAGVAMGKPASDVALIVDQSPRLIDGLCDLALKGLSYGPSEREAVLEEAAQVAHDTAQAHARGWYENPGELDDRAGIAASNAGYFVCKAIRAIKRSSATEGVVKRGYLGSTVDGGIDDH